MLKRLLLLLFLLARPGSRPRTPRPSPPSMSRARPISAGDPSCSTGGREGDPLDVAKLRLSTRKLIDTNLIATSRSRRRGGRRVRPRSPCRRAPPPQDAGLQGEQGLSANQLRTSSGEETGLVREGTARRHVQKSKVMIQAAYKEIGYPPRKYAPGGERGAGPGEAHPRVDEGTKVPHRRHRIRRQHLFSEKAAPLGHAKKQRNTPSSPCLQARPLHPEISRRLEKSGPLQGQGYKDVRSGNPASTPICPIRPAQEKAPQAHRPHRGGRQYFIRNVSIAGATVFPTTAG